MMYNQKLAAAIKVNGKVLREHNKDTVYIPFGSEYSILIKNLHTTKAVVNVFIDGTDTVPGGIVVQPGKEIDLERFVKDGNLTEGNKFKFIERTSKIEQHRGVKLEDGLVRIEYQFEAEPEQNTWYVDKKWVPGHWTPDPYWLNRFDRSITYSGLSGETMGSTGHIGSTCSDTLATSAILRNATLNSVNLSATAQNVSASYVAQANETGITVPGSKSEQKFTQAYIGKLESQTYSMVFKLYGETVDNKPIRQPVTVKHKPRCVTCGKQNKAASKFCSDCGTSLEIV